jgi:hypothetical protein
LRGSAKNQKKPVPDPQIPQNDPGGTTPETIPSRNLVQFFRESPLVGVELDLKRDDDEGRDVDL